MEYKCFKYTLEDHIAHVTLSRGDELNTMIKVFWSELPILIDEISNDGQARVILISSEGKHFTAGMDLGNFSDSELAASNEHQGLQNEAIFRLTKDLQYSFSSLEKSRVPVIVAIQGACVGGGVDMISACDIRYATKDAFFCIQETNLGLVADVGTLQRLPKLIPEGIEGRVPYKGTMKTILHQLTGGLKSSMGYLGCRNIKLMKTKTNFIKISNSSKIESHTHDVAIVKEPPNYQPK